MSELTLNSAVLLGVYALILLGLGWWSYHKENHAGYVIGNRNIGFFATTCSLMAGQFNGGGVFLVYLYAMMTGFGGMWVPFGFVAGYIVIYALARRIREDADKYDDVTVPDFIGRYVGNLTQNYASFIIIGKALLFGTAQLLIAGTVVASILGLDKIWGIAGTATLIGIYMFLGGYLTVVRTDIVQWCFLFIIVIFGLFYYPLPKVDQIINDVVIFDSMTLWGYFFFAFVLIISNADPWQRIMSSKSTDVAQKSLLLSGIVNIVFFFALLAIFVAWKGMIGNDFAFFELFKAQPLSPILLAILGVFTLTAVMSTIDTQVYLFTSAIAKNLMQLNLGTSRIRFVRVTRILTIGLLIFMTLAASFAGGTLQFVLKAFSFAYILAPVILVSLMWKAPNVHKDIICALALSAGLGVYLTMFFTGQFTQMLYFCIPALITGIICILGYVFTHLSNAKTRLQ